MVRKKGLGRGLGALIPPLNPPVGENKPDDQDMKDQINHVVSVEEGSDETISRTERSGSGKDRGVSSTGLNGEQNSNEQSMENKGEDASTGATVSGSDARSAAENPSTSDDSEAIQDLVLRSMQYLPIGLLEANPDQPRKTFDAAALEELKTSIETYGILQPIVVQKYEEPGHPPYRIVAGERRFRAAKEAHLDTVPVVLREASPEETALLSVVENVQRQDLTPVEEAVAYREIMDHRKMTQAQLAGALGKSRPYIANIVRLLQLDEDSLAALRDGRLTSSQGRTLLAEKNLKRRKAFLKLLLEGKSSVQDVEHRRRTSPKKDVYVADAEQQLSETLGTNVRIIKKRRGWAVQIACYTDQDLNALFQRLMDEK